MTRITIWKAVGGRVKLSEESKTPRYDVGGGSYGVAPTRTRKMKLRIKDDGSVEASLLLQDLIESLLALERSSNPLMKEFGMNMIIHMNKEMKKMEKNEEIEEIYECLQALLLNGIIEKAKALGFDPNEV